MSVAVYLRRKSGGANDILGDAGLFGGELQLLRTEPELLGKLRASGLWRRDYRLSEQLSDEQMSETLHGGIVGYCPTSRSGSNRSGGFPYRNLAVMVWSLKTT